LQRKIPMLAAASTALLIAPAVSQAHVSFHPNAIPAGSEVTFNLRVPNEEASADVTEVRVRLPAGVLEALGAPPAGWTFTAKTQTLAKPIQTDDGPVTSEVTEIDFRGGKTPPGQFQSFPVVISLPDSAKAGDVLTLPTLQTYSNGKIVRWIGTSASDENPAPTIDITPAGGPLRDVTGGDAGPPSPLPAIALGAAAASAASTKASSDSSTKTLSIIALIVGALGLGVGGTALVRGRRE